MSKIKNINREIYWLLISVTIIIYSCNYESSNKIVNEISNKNGMKAVIFYKPGDATVPDSYQISLLSNNDQLAKHDIGNAFTCKDNGEATVSIKWIAKDSVLMEYIKSTTTYIKETKVKGVNILYKEK